MKAELALSPMTSGFVEWQGLHRAESAHDINIDNRVLVGATFHLNNPGGLLAVSPRQDYSYTTGVNNHFEF